MSDIASPIGGSLERSILALRFKGGRIRLNLQHIITVAEPFISGFLHGSWCSVLDPLQVIFVTIWVPRKRLAPREDVALAAEASNAIRASYKITQDLESCAMVDSVSVGPLLR